MSAPLAVLAMGNPLLDMSVSEAPELLEKYGLKKNDAVLAEGKQKEMCGPPFPPTRALQAIALADSSGPATATPTCRRITRFCTSPAVLPRTRLALLRSVSHLAPLRDE